MVYLVWRLFYFIHVQAQSWVRFAELHGPPTKSETRMANQIRMTECPTQPWVILSVFAKDLALNEKARSFANTLRMTVTLASFRHLSIRAFFVIRVSDFGFHHTPPLYYR